MIRRQARQLLLQRLGAYPAVALIGPRQCGKTTLAKALGGKYFDLEQLPERLRLDLAWGDLAAGKDLVILDEVFSGLDPLNIELLREMILAEKKAGTTVIFSTHMLAEAEKICDAICLIEGGEVILDGTLAEVRERFPLHSVRVAWEGDCRPPADLPGVLGSEFGEGTWQLTLAEGVDPRTLLPALLEVGPITLFSANRPSLNEIFLAAVARHRREVRS